VKGGQGDRLDEVSLYANVQRGFIDDHEGIDIRYSVFFAYKGGRGHKKHDFDIQHVTVRLIRAIEGDNVNYQAKPSDWTIFAVYYGSHEQHHGVWCYPGEKNVDELVLFGEDEPTHPLVFVSKSSHAFYNRPNHTWWRHMGLCNDHTNSSGAVWYPGVANIEVVCPRDNLPAWISFRGFLGDEKSLLNRDYMHSESNLSQTCFSRFMCGYGL
jgi:hypothetical protein